MGKERRYTPEEVTAVVSSALRRHRESEDISHEELLETGAELGIPRHALEQAASHLATERDMERAKEKWLAGKRRGWRSHIAAFAIVNGFLFLVDLITTGGVWFYWCLLGWGMGLAFHTYFTFFPDPDQVDRGARWILTQEYRRAIK